VYLISAPSTTLTPVEAPIIQELINVLAG